ncbi:MAG: PAS domain S-box protein [Deltaproteobacteria bacterium]|nr:PAS domain S-box protein [Deltaproteobacteria bacterium]
MNASGGDIETRGDEERQNGPDAADLCARSAGADRDARAFDARADLVLVIGPDALLLHLSSGWTRTGGAATEPPIGRPVLEALQSGDFQSADWKAFEHALAAAQQEGSSVLIPLTLRHPEKGWCQLEGRLYGPLDATGNAVVVFHDVTVGFAELTELAESERRFRIIAEATLDMVTETDRDGRFTYVSPACTHVLGYTTEELLGKRPLHILHEDDREAFRLEVVHHQETGKPFAVRAHRLRHKDGSWIWVEATGVRFRRPDGEVRLIGVARDITSRLEAENIRQQLEEQLRGSQKLESLGILAGGIAHDFNNYLTPIVGTAGLMSVELPENSPLQERVEMIRKAARRATDLTAQMLAYAGRTEPRLAPLDVSEAILDMQLLLESTAAHRAELIYDLGPDLPLVKADDGQIGQVVINLVANAAEALGDQGGRIEIRTGQIEVDRIQLRDYHLGHNLDEGTCVYIEVCDDGVGIDAETRKHLFEPFFSTKFTGRGLGLAVVLGIVKSHRGALRIDGGPRSGTCFRIILPAASIAPDESTESSFEKQESHDGWKQSGTFLVVDDDEGARELTSILLERAGFHVLSAADGVEAIEIFRTHAAEISGVVLDNTMPGMSGGQVLDAIRQIVADVPIIVASGYSRERVSDALLGHSETRFLRKPFDAEELLASVRQLLGTR